ncbi:MAG: molecular chaperone DnaJ [Minisyncoccia bacterium]
MQNKDYYKVLGVNKDATQDDIKKAFRKLAHQHHPDKNKGNDTKFKECSEAYSVLSDETKRKQYDMYGSNYSAGGEQGGNPFGGGFEGFDFSQFSRNGGGQGFEFDINDIFGDFFGGGRREQVRRGRDISVDLEISFSESIFGVTKTIHLTKNNTCSDCKGGGAQTHSEQIKCSDCAGRGHITTTKRSIFGTFATESVCKTCNGTGKVPKDKCNKCHGSGIDKKESQLEIKVPAGINSGESLRLTGAGEAISGGQTGDLYIRIHVKKHPVFTRVNHDLVMTLEIKLSDALLGAEIPVLTLDGEIAVSVPSGVNNGEILRLKGKGVPVGRQRGDILVTIRVKMPKHLSKTARKTVEELKKEGL